MKNKADVLWIHIRAYTYIVYKTMNQTGTFSIY